MGELRGLTSDGLLQRFIPIMMGPSTLAQDRACDEGAYGLLILKLIFAEPQWLTFDDAALATMNELRCHLHELEQVSVGLADGFQSFVGKLAGLAGSLALILHVASDPDKSAARPGRSSRPPQMFTASSWISSCRTDPEFDPSRRHRDRRRSLAQTCELHSTPAQRLSVLLCSFALPYQPSPKGSSGRPCGGPDCLNRFSASISGASARVRPPRGAAAG